MHSTVAVQGTVASGAITAGVVTVSVLTSTRRDGSLNRDECRQILDCEVGGSPGKFASSVLSFKTFTHLADRSF